MYTPRTPRAHARVDSADFREILGSNPKTSRIPKISSSKKKSKNGRKENPVQILSHSLYIWHRRNIVVWSTEFARGSKYVSRSFIYFLK